MSAGKEHQSGKTAAEEAAEEAVEDFDAGLDPAVLPEDRKLDFSSVGFSRMRTDWKGGDRTVLSRVQQVAQDRLFQEFQDAYAIMSDIYDIVRIPECEPDGTVIMHNGFPVWRTLPTGAYEEDWSLLMSHQREEFLYRLVTSSFEWSQRAADLWGEAMFAKAIWAESYATEFDAPMGGTDSVRKARGDMKAAEARHFAIFVAYASRKADALVRSMERLELRISQVMKG